MLENVHLSRKLAKAAFQTRMQELHGRLLELQRACWEARRGSLIVFEGWDTAGKGSTIRKLTERLEPRGFKLYATRPLFEGWDAAGKGGAIRRVTEKLDPRGYEVFAIAAPHGEERTHHYLWRFWRRLLPAEEKQIVISQRRPLDPARGRAARRQSGATASHVRPRRAISPGTAAAHRGVTPMPDATAPAHAARPSARGKPANLNHPTYYINRELSWLEFNRRVLEEVLDPGNPLLERVKFVSIFHSNLDEFFMIRVSGLRRQLAGGALKAPPDGMRPAEQLAAIHQQLIPMLDRIAACWRDDLLPKLREAGIKLLDYRDLKSKQRKLLRRHFKREIFPALTPLAFDPGHPFPHISNLSINLAVVINEPGYGERFARLKVPHPLTRLLRIPSEEKADSYQRLGLEEPRFTHFVWLEEVVAANLDLLFPGHEIVSAHPFRVTRDADLEIEEDEASDLLTAMREVVGQRHFGSVVRLEVAMGMPDRIRKILTQNLALAPYQVYEVDGPLGTSDLIELSALDRLEHKYPPFSPRLVPQLAADEDIFAAIRRRPILLYHPYDSFTPVVDFVRKAARDPDVVAIKQTLYRVGPNSPIVQALMEARENGKQVSTLVELKARFDEANNIVWARALERAGVHVVYGLMGLKVHAKMCLVVRREADGMARYAHLGTGNYNPITARIYADLGYFTCDPDLTADVADLFNALTGYSRKTEYRKLVVAPARMRDELLARIHREIRLHRKNGGGRLAFKMNALVDKSCIKALYEASQAGVQVDLQTRGICCLRPGVPRVSENIRVTSIVGRFLEHGRLYYFRNGGDEEILIGSADIMPRNLDGRVELLFPVEDPRLLGALRDDILELHLRDNRKARRLREDGTWERPLPAADAPVVDAQASRLAAPGGWHLEELEDNPRGQASTPQNRPASRPGGMASS